MGLIHTLALYIYVPSLLLPFLRGLLQKRAFMSQATFSMKRFGSIMHFSWPCLLWLGLEEGALVESWPYSSLPNKHKLEKYALNRFCLISIIFEKSGVFAKKGLLVYYLGKNKCLLERLE